jgi:hypothetical protein
MCFRLFEAFISILVNFLRNVKICRQALLLVTMVICNSSYGQDTKLTTPAAKLVNLPVRAYRSMIFC